MKICKSLLNILLSVGVFFLVSCNDDPAEVLDNKINKAIRSGNNIDEKEWNELAKYVFDNKYKFSEFISGDSVNAKSLTAYILDFAKEHRKAGQANPEIFPLKSELKGAAKPQVKLFIENSGSMDGYVFGKRDFENVVSEILVSSKIYCSTDSSSNLDIYFINKKVYPASNIQELTDFAEALETDKNALYMKGERSASIFNEVLKIILDSTNYNTISVLVSDCIYSLEPGKDTRGSLAYQRNGTYEAFADKLSKNPRFDISTCIYRYSSDFEGFYYPYNFDNSKNKKIDLRNINAKRPYYIWVIGESQKVAEFVRKINFENKKGYENSYTLSNLINQSSPANHPYFTVLKETNRLGSFKQANKGEKDLRSINGIQYDHLGNLQFSIAIDLNDVPVDSTYLINVNNYVVTQGFTLKSVEAIDKNKLSKKDLVKIDKTNVTHLLTVSTTNKYTIQDFKLELSNKIPDWVKLNNDEDDTDILSDLDRTFGFEYLVQGVKRGYEEQNPNHNSYFEINVSILNGDEGGIGFSSILMNIFSILICLVGIFAVILALKRRKEQKI
jgi:hypothetical protein